MSAGERKMKYCEDGFHPANKLANVRRRVARANNFPVNTCPASRHIRMMADALSRGQPYRMLQEEPEHCAGSMYAVVEALWKARTKLRALSEMAEGNRPKYYRNHKVTPENEPAEIGPSQSARSRPRGGRSDGP